MAKAMQNYLDTCRDLPVLFDSTRISDPLNREGTCSMAFESID